MVKLFSTEKRKGILPSEIAARINLEKLTPNKVGKYLKTLHFKTIPTWTKQRKTKKLIEIDPPYLILQAKRYIPDLEHFEHFDNYKAMGGAPQYKQTPLRSSEDTDQPDVAQDTVYDVIVERVVRNPSKPLNGDKGVLGVVVGSSDPKAPASPPIIACIFLMQEPFPGECGICHEKTILTNYVTDRLEPDKDALPVCQKCAALKENQEKEGS